MKKNKRDVWRKRLGFFSLGGLIVSLFMIYIELTKKAITFSYTPKFFSFSGIAFFVLGFLGISLVFREIFIHR